MIDAPRFRSEAEEAEWWDSHQDLAGPPAETWPPRRNTVQERHGSYTRDGYRQGTPVGGGEGDWLPGQADLEYDFAGKPRLKIL